MTPETNDLVCDRCGAPAWWCAHSSDPDYSLQTKDDYRRECDILIFMGLVIAIGTIVAITLEVLR